MPGVLIIEALAQLTAVMYCSEYFLSKDDDNTALSIPVDVSSRVGYLTNINNFKFKKPIYPGDQMELRAIKKKSMGLMSSIQVSAYVSGECVAEGVIGVSQKS